MHVSRMKRMWAKASDQHRSSLLGVRGGPDAARYTTGSAAVITLFFSLSQIRLLKTCVHKPGNSKRMNFPVMRI